MKLLRRLLSFTAWKKELMFAADAAIFAWSTLSFRKNFEFPVKGKKILIVSLTDWPPRAAMEGMLALSFKLRGYQPVILTQRTCKKANLYFRMLGIRDLLFFDDHFKAASRDNDDELSRTLLGSVPDFAKVFGLRSEGAETGKHALSTLIRKLRMGTLGFEDDKTRQLVREGIVKSIRSARAAQSLFEDFHPDAVLFVEKGYTSYAEIFDVAVEKGLNCIQYVHAQKSDLFLFKRYSKRNKWEHPFALSTATWEHVKALPRDDAAEQKIVNDLIEGYKKGGWFNRKHLLEGKSVKGTDAVRTQLGLKPGRKVAVIFSHVLWDATFFYGKNLFKDYEEWLVETVRAACKNTNVEWIVKVHPDYTWKMKEQHDTRPPRDVAALQERIGTLPPHIHLVMPDIDISTLSFFEIADYCITVRGTAGIESACMGIPVLTAGTGRYSNLGFTHDFETPEEYVQAIETIDAVPPMTENEKSLARRYAATVFNIRPIQITAFELLHRGLKHVGTARDRWLKIRAKNLPELAQDPPLTAVTHWIFESTEDDFLRS